MREHVAVLADPKQFDMTTSETRPQGEGVSVVVAKRSDSLTREGVAYRFSAETFTTEQVEAWLAERGVRCERIECADVGEEMEFEVLAVGTFNAQRGGRVSFDRTHLEQIATTSNALIEAGMLRPPLKLGHGEDQEKVRAMFPEGGEPALGWVKRLRVDGDRLLALAANIPTRFLEAVKNGAWRTRSAEILPSWTDPTGKRHEMVFRAVAWLGAVHPAVPTLADLVGLSDEERGAIVILNEDQHGAGGPRDGEVKDDNASGSADVVPQSGPTEKEIVEMAENAALQAQLDAANARERAAREELVSLKLAEAVKDRRITPGQVDGEKAIALAQADPSAYLTTVMARPQMPDMTKPLADGNPDPAQVKPSPKKGEARLIELAEKIAEDRKVPYGEALCLASVAEPETYSTYYVEAHPLRSAGKEN